MVINNRIEPAGESITISIPVYNEEATLEWIVRESIGVLKRATRAGCEVLIVNDGSTDNTEDIGRRLVAEYKEVRLYNHPENKGFAAAQHSCYQQAQNEWIFLLPADGQVLPQELYCFLPRCPDSDLLLGVRSIRVGEFFRGIFSHLYYRVVQMLFGLKFNDFGSCLMIRKGLYEKMEIRSTSPVAMTELVVKALLGGARVKEVVVKNYPRRHGRGKGSYSYLDLPRIVYDLLRLYREVNSRDHEYFKNPVDYQERFMAGVLRKRQK